MNQYRVVFVAGIAFGVTGMIWLVLSILSYGAPPQPTLIPVEENIDASGTSNVTHVDRYPQTTYVTSNLTLAQAQDLQKEIWKNTTCELSSYTQEDDPASYQYLMPEAVTFEYIAPPQPVMRIGCSQTMSGLNYVYVSFVNGTLVSAESIITVHTAEQAVEYLKVFPRASDQFLFNEEEYNEALNGADLIEHSPIRLLYVVYDGNSFTVDVNVRDIHNGEIRYEKWILKEKPDASGFHEWNPAESMVVAKLHSIA